MSESVFKALCMLLAAGFSMIFLFIVVPPLVRDFDVLGAFAAGFVNPYAAGYSADVLFCWVILAVWVIYERIQLGLRHGGWCLLVGVVPGVAVGFAVYLVVRAHQTETRIKRASTAH